MRHVTSSALLALAATVAAQTPAEFPYGTVTENLLVTYNSTNTIVSPPGVLLPRSAVLEAPTLYRPSVSPSDANFLAILVDQDVNYNGNKTDFLHWFQPNLVGVGTSALSFDATAQGASPAVGATYVPPSPPTDGAHRYTFLLYVQPSNWAVPSSFSAVNPPADLAARLGFNVTAFAAAGGLDTPVAAVFMRVLNGTAQETSANYSPTGTAAPVTDGSMTVMSTAAGASTTAATTGTSISSSAASSASSVGASASSVASSASASTTSSSAAGVVAPKHSMKELTMGVVMAIVGAGAWML